MAEKYIRTYNGRWIHHIVEFDSPITEEFAKEYVKGKKFWSYHPYGYGGDLRVYGNKLEYVHYDSCD